jgi:hypothetical protein
MIGRRVIGDGLVFDSRINISEQDCYQRSTPSMVSLRPSAFDAYRSSRRQRKKVEMLFAHLKRILRLDRLRLRGPCGARDEFLLAATAQHPRKLAKLITPPTSMPAT